MDKTSTSVRRYWSDNEHALFLEGLKMYGRRDVQRISEHVRTRSPTQVRSHAQKYFLRVKSNNRQNWDAGLSQFDDSAPHFISSPLAGTAVVKSHVRLAPLIEQSNGKRRKFECTKRIFCWGSAGGLAPYLAAAFNCREDTKTLSFVLERYNIMHNCGRFSNYNFSDFFGDLTTRDESPAGVDEAILSTAKHLIHYELADVLFAFAEVTEGSLAHCTRLCELLEQDKNTEWQHVLLMPSVGSMVAAHITNEVGKASGFFKPDSGLKKLAEHFANNNIDPARIFEVRESMLRQAPVLFLQNLCDNMSLEYQHEMLTWNKSGGDLWLSSMFCARIPTLTNSITLLEALQKLGNLLDLDQISLLFEEYAKLYDK